MGSSLGVCLVKVKTAAAGSPNPTKTAANNNTLTRRGLAIDDSCAGRLNNQFERFLEAGWRPVST